MKLRRWDIVFVPIDEKDVSGHPAVILSNDSLLENPHQSRINVLIGTKRTPAISPAPHHVILNGSDGLDLQTLIDTSFVYAVRKATILHRAGSVGLHRRQEIQRKLRASLGLG